MKRTNKKYQTKKSCKDRKYAINKMQKYIINRINKYMTNTN